MEESIIHGFFVSTERKKGCTVMHNRLFVRQESILDCLKILLADGYHTEIKIVPFETSESEWNRIENLDAKKSFDEGESNMNKVYVVTCEEIVEGDGPVCWYGEQEYIFKTHEEAQKFIDERLPTLTEQNDKNRLFDENEKPTGQFLVTYSISCKMQERYESNSADEELVF